MLAGLLVDYSVDHARPASVLIRGCELCNGAIGFGKGRREDNRENFCRDCSVLEEDMEERESVHKDEPGGIATLRQRWAGEHREYQRSNPFSGAHVPAREPRRAGEEYGRPKKGSKTERRGKDAQRLVDREIEELLYIIRRNGESGPDGNICVRFGKLFGAYVTISNKVVGLLLRARKHGLIAFDGEMLWQGRDDQVLITLLQ